MTRPQDQARSISKKLSTLSKKLSVSFPKIFTEFILERLTVRLLLDADLGSRLIFKGGYVSLRVYESPRYTVDLDALLRNGSLESILKAAQTTAEKDVGDGVWFRLETTIDLETQGDYGGLRLVFRTGLGEVLPNRKRAQIINLDIGKGDPVVPGPVEVETPFLLGGGKISWSVYPAETTVAEKLHALVVRSSESSRSKDIFDLNLLLAKCDPVTLKKSVAETFRFRGDSVPKNLVEHLQRIDCKLLKMGWASAVGEIPNAPDFDEEFAELIGQLKVIWK